MLSTGRYLYVVFMCQQAIEKLVKGLYVLFCEGEPPRTHSISIVFKKVVDHSDKFEDLESYLEKRGQYGSFFERLLAYYIAERYPSYKEKLSETVDRREATEVLSTTEEVFKWLLSLKQYAPE